MRSSRARLRYGVGALAVLSISAGLMMIAYAVSAVSIDIYQVIAWLLGPLGAYTIAYSLTARAEGPYYLAWGAVMLATALASGLRAILNIYIILGGLLITIAVIGLISYMRGPK